MQNSKLKQFDQLHKLVQSFTKSQCNENFKPLLVYISYDFILTKEITFLLIKNTYQKVYEMKHKTLPHVAELYFGILVRHRGHEEMEKSQKHRHLQATAGFGWVLSDGETLTTPNPHFSVFMPQLRKQGLVSFSMRSVLMSTFKL